MAVSQHPDPSLSASIYCAGRLDEVLHRAVAPFWRHWRETAADDDAYLWVMRYARRGEHLKVRIHVDEAAAAEARSHLEQAVGRYLATVPDADAEPPRPSTPKATPIDREDYASDDADDRSFHWTTYQRSHVSLGASPYQEHDGYVTALTQCLARSTELLLARLETNCDGRAAFGQRQGLLLQLLIAGLGAARFDDGARARYLRYHRDWLLRAALKYGRARGNPRKLTDTLTRFAGRIEAMGADAERVGRTARDRWAETTGAEGAPDADDELEHFARAVAALLAVVEPFAAERAFRIDPFAELPTFPALFRVLHGVANQVGLDALNESFVHHLLLAVATEGDTKHEPVALVPTL